MDDVNVCLIENVRCHPCIFNKKNPDFKNTGVKIKAWNEVAEVIGKPVEECRRKWTVLRERYTKELKKQTLSSGSGAIEVEDWPYYYSMDFLREFVQPRRTRTNIFEKEEEEVTTNMKNHDEEATLTETGNVQRPKKRCKRDDAYDEACDAIKAAADSIRASNSIPAPPPSSANSRRRVNENFLKSIVDLLEPLQESDQDYALSQIEEFVVQLRQDRLYSNEEFLEESCLTIMN